MNGLEYQLGIISSQLTNMQKQLTSVQRLLVSQQSNTGKGGGVSHPVIVGVKDITSAQLYHAYKKGLNMEQLCQLADGKYTAEQIYKKLQKIGGNV